MTQLRESGEADPAQKGCCDETVGSVGDDFLGHADGRSTGHIW
jgi:hypothetical protein